MRWHCLGWVACVALLGVGSSACGDDGQSTGPGAGGSGGAAGSGGGGGLPAPICHPNATPWQAGTQAFQDSTAAWGLDAIGAQGVRLNAVDFDADGWADLVVRMSGSVPNYFLAGGRTVWLLRNTHDGKFEDVTEASGVLQNRTEADPTKGRPAEVFAWGDVNNDGYLDVITGRTTDTAHPTQETTELLLNNGDGTFSLGPAGNPFRKPNDAVAGVSFVDFDRDGNLDVWIVGNVLNNLPLQDRLYQGDGAGNFVDVTAERGLSTISWSVATVDDLNNALGHSIGWAGNACDLNNDGSPELLASSYGRAPNLQWRATGTGAALTFVNQSIDSGYAFDGNQDWSDNESARCWCKLHPTDTGCAGVSPPQYITCNVDADAFRWDNTYDQEPFRLGGNSGATMCADVDNDGWIDLVTSEIVHWDVGQSSDAAELMVNAQDPNVRFDRPGNTVTGLDRSYANLDWNEGIMSGSVFDFDNDGWADIYFGNSDYPGDHGLLYHQDSAGHFVPVPIAQSIDHHRSHGSAVADFDHDGDLDLVVGHSFARCHQDANDDSECYATQQVRLFENVLGDKGNFVSLRLVGATGTNRAAIGARVTVTAGGVTQTRDAEGGHGHYGAQDDLTLLFGLGDACEADVSVRWPDANLTVETMHLPAGYRFVLEQGAAPAVDADGGT
jgi:enediyne biosynthesis protein E4